MTNPGSDDLAGCGKTVPCCHSERSEEYRPAHFHEHTRFFLRYAQDRLRLLRMTAPPDRGA